MEKNIINERIRNRARKEMQLWSAIMSSIKISCLRNRKSWNEKTLAWDLLVVRRKYFSHFVAHQSNWITFFVSALDTFQSLIDQKLKQSSQELSQSIDFDSFIRSFNDLRANDFFSNSIFNIVHQNDSLWFFNVSRLLALGVENWRKSRYSLRFCYRNID